MSRPVHIFRDGDQFFAAFPNFIDLQVSTVVWLEPSEVQAMLEMLKNKDVTKIACRWGMDRWAVQPDAANFAWLDIERVVSALSDAPRRTRAEYERDFSDDFSEVDDAKR